MNGTVSDAQQAFFATIASKATTALGQLGNVSITPIQTAGQVFYYDYVIPNSLDFNTPTYNVLDSTVSAVSDSPPGTAVALDLGGSFNSNYLELLNAMSWELSAADAATVSNAAIKSSNDQTTLVTSWEGEYGPITAAQMAAVDVATPIDYIMYQVTNIWSGTLQNKQPPLNLTAGVRNLQASLPYMPSSAQSLIGPLTTWINDMEAAWPISNLQSTQMWVRNQLITNLNSPPATFQTWDPTQPNAPAMNMPAYSTNPSAPVLFTDLNATSTNTLEVDCTASQSSSDEVNVNFDVNGGGDIPIDAFILGVSGSVKFNLFSANGTGTSASVQLTYPNPTLVAILPQLWQQSAASGWYLAGMIQQAATNPNTGTPQNPVFANTGYAFPNGAPNGFNLGVGGNFGRLAGLAVSQMPTVVITYATGDYSEFNESFDENTSWSLSFLGIPLGGANQSVYQAKAHQNTVGGGFTLTFAPPSQTGLASYSLYGFIIGGYAVYPGAQDV
jgi:hypothetical protein